MNNKRKFVRIFYQIIIYTLIKNYCFGQYIDEEKAMRANSFQQELSIKSNGIPNINISILPSYSVGLEYDASGIKPNQVADIVGLGWNLQAGGELNRIVHGFPDEAEAINFHPRGISDSNKQTWATINQNLQVYNYVGQYMPYTMLFSPYVRDGGYEDPSPDEFSYHILGQNGRFMFKPDGTVLADHKIQVRVITGLTGHVRVQADRIPNLSFEIVLEDGTRCFFEQSEGVSTAEKDRDYTYYPHPDFASINTWKITRILLPGQITPITFEYEYGFESYSQCYAQETLFGFPGFSDGFLTASSGIYNTYAATWPANMWNASERYAVYGTPYLKIIRGNGFVIEFTYAVGTYTDPAQTPARSLNRISLKNERGTLLKAYHFTYNRISRTRFLLMNIEELLGTSQAVNGHYRFEYNMQSMPDFNYFPYDDFYRLQTSSGQYTGPSSPLLNTAGVDWWGYYSGQKSPYQTLISFEQDNTLSSLSNADRQPNPVTTQALTLTSITTPQGGRTNYEYENNDYAFVNNSAVKPVSVLAGGLRIKRITQTDGMAGSAPQTVSYAYTMPNNPSLSSGVIENEPTFTFDYSPVSGIDYSIARAFSLLPTRIEYSYIKETYADGSYSVSSYRTSKDFPHREATEPGYGAYIMHQFPQPDPVVANAVLNEIRRFPHVFVAAPGLDNHMRGLLVNKKDYSSNGLLVREVKLTYSSYTVGSLDAMDNVFVPAYNRHPGTSGTGYGYGDFANLSCTNCADFVFWRVFQIPVSIPILSSKIETIFDRNNATRYKEITTEYGFNSLNFKKSYEKVTDNSGIERKEQYYYTCDYTDNHSNGQPQMGGVLRDLKARNMLTTVVERRQLRNNQVIGGELREFNSTGQPTNVYLLEIDSPITLPFIANNYFSTTTLYKHKTEIDYAFLTQVPITNHTLHGSPISTLWEGNAGAPVATIVNSDLGEDPIINGTWSVNTPLSTGNLLSVPVNDNTEIITIAVSSYYFPGSGNNTKGPVGFNLKLQNSVSGEIIPLAPFLENAPGGTTLVRTFTVAPPPGTYMLSCAEVTAGGSFNATLSVFLSRYSVRRKAFYTSFEHWQNNQIRSVSKTGSQSLEGMFSLPLPSQAGTYKLSYWHAPVGTTPVWQYHEEIVQQTTGGPATKVLGNAGQLLDEVRLHPARAVMETKTFESLKGATSGMDANGLQITYEYDESGRIKLVRNNKGDIIKVYEYHTKQ